MCEMSAFKLLTVTSLQSTQLIILNYPVLSCNQPKLIQQALYHMTTLSLPPLFFQLACHRARQFFFFGPCKHHHVWLRTRILYIVFYNTILGHVTR